MDQENIICERVDNFLLDQDVTDNSKQVYKTNVLLFFRWAINNDLDPFSLKRSDIILYKNHLSNSQKAELTIDSYLTTVRKFFQWTELNDIHPNITVGIKNPKRYKGFRKTPLTKEQVVSLINSFEIKSIIGKRNKAIIFLMVVTGLRSIEVTRLNIGDIQTKHRKLGLYVQGKGRKKKDEFVRITDVTFDFIQNYLRKRNKFDDDDPLFISHGNRSQYKRLNQRSISRMIKEHMRKIGLNSGKYTAHSLRHTCAILALKTGATLEQVSAKLRHTYLTTTQLYTRYIEEEIRLEDEPGILIEKLILNEINANNDRIC